jgi:hypothetical protein
MVAMVGKEHKQRLTRFTDDTSCFLKCLVFGHHVDSSLALKLLNSMFPPSPELWLSPARHKAVLWRGLLLMMVLLGTIASCPKAIAVQTKSRNTANIFMVWFPSIGTSLSSLAQRD